MRSVGTNLIIDDKKGNISTLNADYSLTYKDDGLGITLPAVVIMRMHAILTVEVERLGEDFDQWANKQFENLNTKDN